jgi:hypothetical protein
MELDRYRPILNNGVLNDATPEKARADVAWYKQCGYGGFAINGGTRTPIENLNDWLSGFMQACRYYVEAAKELGMNVWIFDEWGYPSGTACGQVLTEERFRAKKYRLSYDIILEAGQSLCLPVPDKFVSACAFPVDYFSFYCNQLSSERIYPQDGQLCYTAGQRTRVIAVAWEYTTFITHTMPMTKVDKSTVGTIDILSKEAVAKFLRCMHEWYVEPLGDEFGKTIQGFFYDEPELCYDFPYTEELPEAFLKRFGYPLEDILPELLGWKFRSALVSGASSRLVSDSSAGAQLCKYMADYEAVWTDLLARNFYGQIQEWCHAHGLLSVGHQDLDNQLSTLRTVSGDFWENNKYNDRPGIDVIWDNIAPDKFADFARYAGCAKRTFGTSGAISETFAEMGPSMYPDRMRYTMEQQILRGVDQFFGNLVNGNPLTVGIGIYLLQLLDFAVIVHKVEEGSLVDIHTIQLRGHIGQHIILQIVSQSANQHKAAHHNDTGHRSHRAQGDFYRGKGAFPGQHQQFQEEIGVPLLACRLSSFFLRHIVTSKKEVRK